MDRLYEMRERNGKWPMDLNTASRHQLKMQYCKYIKQSHLWPSQEDGPTNMSSLMETTYIDAEYWLQEVRTEITKPISEVGDVDLQIRFDDLCMADRPV